MARFFLILVSIIFLCSCGSLFQEQDEQYYLVGGGWYHPDKTRQEMDRDYQECHSVACNAPSTYNPTTVETHCMCGRGYVWK